MTFRVGGLLLLLLAVPALGGGDDPKEKPATPAEQYQALVKEAEKAQQDFFKLLQEASDEERHQTWKKAPNFGPKFLVLAEKYPKDSIAVDALARVVANVLPAPSDPSVTKALDVLLRDHLASEKLGDVCEALGAKMFQEGAEKFLLAVLENSPRKEVRGSACLALAELSHGHARISERIKKDPDTAKRIEEFYGKEAVQSLGQADGKELAQRIEKYFRDFADTYAVDLPPRRVVQTYLLLGYYTDAASERALRGLLAKDTRKEVQGPVSLVLARLLSERASSLPEAEVGEAAKLSAESERLLEQAIAKYADVTVESVPGSGTVGTRAEKQLFALRHLSVGKVAPDIEGEDQDGKRFKLSDYRGKVVLLDFWSQH